MASIVERVSRAIHQTWSKDPFEDRDEDDVNMGESEAHAAINELYAALYEAGQGPAAEALRDLCTTCSADQWQCNCRTDNVHHKAELTDCNLCGAKASVQRTKEGG